MEKDSEMPFSLMPAGRDWSESRAKTSFFEHKGNSVSVGMEYTRLVLKRRKPARCSLHSSRRLTVPIKLSSINRRELLSLVMPARREGFAAQSRTQSIAGRVSRSFGY